MNNRHYILNIFNFTTRVGSTKFYEYLNLTINI
jgi:hypothetical protein